ncbi:MAG: glycerophosphodiester phosphodiesterase family protein [Candidatus Scalindua sp.]
MQISFTGFAQKSDIDTILDKFHDANSEYVMVAAHRAAHNVYPENSISAIKHSIELGVDIAELDARATKDGIAVIMHDGEIDRTTNGTGKVEDHTLAELKTFRLKKKDGTLTDETIPTFEEALKVAYGNIMVVIDVKTINVKPIVEAVTKTKTQNQVLYYSSNPDNLKNIRYLDESSMLMPLARSYQAADTIIKVFNPKVVHIYPYFYTTEVTELIRSNNARVWINALGKTDEKIRKGKVEKGVEKLLKHKANILSTDEPELLIQYLKSKGLRN